METFLGAIALIIGMVLSAMIVNKVMRLYMKFMGTNVMFFNGATKFGAIFLLGCLIAGIIMGVLGFL